MPDSSPNQPTRPSTAGVPPKAWLLLGLMTAFNVLNFVDRQLIAGLAPLIMADLGLSRADIGLLVGFAFVVIYTVVGMGLGVAADRWSRRWLIGAGLAVWSAMTAASGAARGFAGLAVPRVLVGVGEATLTPAALSMLADVFPPRRLGMASSVYYTGLPIGTALSLVIAGWAGPRFGWRACFYALGALGLASVALLALVREPPRQGGAARAGPSPAAPPLSLGAIVRDLTAAVRTRPALGLVMLGGAALAYGSASAMHGVTWLVEERGFPFARAAFAAGAMAVVSGLAGNLAGGWFSDWCRRRWTGGRAWSLVVIAAFFAPFSAAFFLLPPSTPVFYVCWFFSAASTVTYFGPVFAAVQELAPAHVRSSAVAFGLLVMNMVGVGPGPWITGLIGDHASLSLGLLVSVGVTLTAVVPFAAAARVTPADRAVPAPSA
ncbi:MAG: MFS transporter [Vicinamibacterales bacterium]|nr:MFS transporter [Vicinamibacterales bacterium]